MGLTFKIKVLQIRFTYLTLWSNHFTKLGHEWFIDCGLLCDEIASISLFVYSLRRTLYLSKVNRRSHNKEKVKSWILEDFINSIFFLEKISSKKLFRFVLFSFFLFVYIKIWRALRSTAATLEGVRCGPAKGGHWWSHGK